MHDPPAVGQIIGLAHLAALKLGQLREMGVGEDAAQGSAVSLGKGHGPQYRKAAPNTKSR